MNCTEILKARVTPELKLQAKAIADREFLTEAAWLKRIVMKEIRAADRGYAEFQELRSANTGRQQEELAKQLTACGKPVYVRLRAEDRLLLDARAAARGMRTATYLSVLTRGHLRALTPLPQAELLSLKRTIAELAAIGRNINQIAKVANKGGRLPGSVRKEFRAMLSICEALRVNTKAVLKANEASWSAEHG